jgi:type II secretory pathway pseudopilin PulG
MEALLPFITVIGSVLLVLLKSWQDASPERKKEAQNADTQALRNAIASSDIPAVNNVLNGLLSDVSLPTTGTASDSSERQHSDESIAQRINDVLKS